MSRSELYNRCRHTRNIQHMVIVCQCCEPLFVFNGLWRWSLWLRALSSWRRVDAWGVETGEICDNTVVWLYHGIMVWLFFVKDIGRLLHCFFWTQLLFGGAVCCMQGMVTNIYIWTVFCGHNSFLARRFWHYSGWLQLPVGGSGWCWCFWRWRAALVCLVWTRRRRATCCLGKDVIWGMCRHSRLKGKRMMFIGGACHELDWYYTFAQLGLAHRCLRRLVGTCIAFFGLNCCLAGRSVACKAADISTSHINIYTIVDMVSKKCTATVFFGHKWLTC